MAETNNIVPLDKLPKNLVSNDNIVPTDKLPSNLKQSSPVQESNKPVTQSPKEESTSIIGKTYDFLKGYNMIASGAKALVGSYNFIKDVINTDDKINRTEEEKQILQIPNLTKQDVGDKTAAWNQYLKNTAVKSGLRIDGQDKDGNDIIDTDNPSNIFALQKAQEHIQQQEALVKDPTVTDTDIADIAAQKINKLDEEHQYWKLSETYNSQGADPEIARDDEEVRMEQVSKEKQKELDQEKEINKNYFNQLRIQKRALDFDNKFNANPEEEILKPISDVEKELVAEGIKQNSTGNLMYERAELENSQEIDPAKVSGNDDILSGVKSTSVSDDIYKMSSLKREEAFKKGADARIAQMNYKIASAQEEQKQWNDYNKQFEETVGNNKLTPEGELEKQKIIDGKAKALQDELNAVKYRDKILALRKANSTYIDKFENTTNAYEKAINGDSKLTNVIVGTLKGVADVAVKDVIIGLPSFVQRAAIRHQIDNGSLTEEEGLKQNLAREQGIDQNLLNFKYVRDLPSTTTKSLFTDTQGNLTFNPELLAYTIAKTTAESYALVAPGLAVEGVFKNALAKAVLQNAVITGTSDLMMSSDMIRGFEKEGINPKTAYILGRNLAIIEGFTEAQLIPERKIFKGLAQKEALGLGSDEAREVAIDNVVNQLKLPAKTGKFYKDYRNLIVTSIKNKWEKSKTAREVAKLYSEATLGEYGEELEGDILTNPMQHNLENEDASFRAQVSNLNAKNQLVSFLTTAVSMAPTQIYGAINQHSETQKVANYMTGRDGEYFLKSIKADYESGKLTKEEAIKATQVIKHNSEIYSRSELLNTLLDNSPLPQETKDIQKLNLFEANFNIDKLQKELLTPKTDEEKEEIFKQLNTLNLKVSKINESANISVEEGIKQQVLLETKELNSELSDEIIEKSNKDKLTTYKQALEDGIGFGLPQELQKVYQEKLNKINAQLEKLNPKPQENLSNKDYLLQNLKEANLTEEQLNLLTDEQIVEKANELKSKSKQSEEYFNLKLKEVQALSTIEEQGDALANLVSELRQENSPFKAQAIEELDKIDKQLEEQQAKASEITFSDNTNSASFPENTIVTYEGGSYKVQKDKDGNPILFNDITKAQVKPSDVTGIKKREIEVVQEDKGEDVFGKREEPVKVISTEDLLKLAESKDKSVTNKEFQNKAKEVAGEKHIAKMNEEQRVKMEKYLNTLKSRKEKAEDRKKAIEEEKKQGLAEIEKSGLTTRLSKAIKAVWSNTTNRFVFFKSNGEQITSTSKIVELAEELANKTGFVKTWWDSLITEEQKQKVINYLNDLEYEERKDNGLTDESIVTPRLALLQLLKNAKFSPEILKDLTDVNAKAWTNDKAKSLDDYVRNYVSNTDVSEGVLAGMDEQEITNEILGLIAEFPNGITEKDIQEEKQSDTNIVSKIIINDFAEEFGLDLEVVKDKLIQEIEDFKKEAANSTQLTTEEILNLEEASDELLPAVTDDAEIVVEVPVVVDTPEAKEIVKQGEKEQKKTESQIFRSGKVQNTTWNKAISKILKSIENYTISVINANKVAFSQLPESFPGSAQKFWNSELAKKENKGKTIQEIRNEYNKKNNDKFLAISDKQGNLLYFDEEGNITTEEKGSLALSNFPVLGNEATQEARDSKTKTTFTVKQITNEPISVSVKTESKSAKQLVEENKLTPTLETEGRNVFLVNNGQKTQIFSRNLSEDEVQTIINLTKKWNTNKQEIKEFIEGLLYQGFKTPINFVFDYKASRIVANHVVDGVNGEEFTEEELRDFLSAQPVNFSKFVNGKNKPFITFTVKEGITNGVQKATEHPSYQDFILSNFSINSNQKELKDKFYVEVGDRLGSETAQIQEAETQPKQEPEIPVKEEVKETIVENSPTEEAPKKSLINKFANKKKNDSDRTLNRGKHLVTETTEEQEKEAGEWIKNSPLFEQKEELRILRNVINSDAWATYKDAVITLWQGGRFTDVYHEAWHKFSQLHLTKKQKLALYNEVKNSNPKYKEYSDFQIEELIAEDFRKYAIAFKAGNPLILNNRPQRNSIFRRVANYFKALFKREDLQTYYEKLYTGNIKSYERNLDNSFFAELNRGIDGVVDGKAITLTDEQTKDLYKGINSLIGEIFQNVKKPSSLMLDNTNNVSTKVYGFVKEDLENIAIDLSKSLLDRESEYPKMSKEDKAKYDADYQALENVAFAIDNWAEVVKNHPKFSKEFKNVNVEDYLNEEESPITQSVEGEVDTTDDEAIERGSEIAKNSNTSSKEAASKETIALISSLHKFENGKKVFNKFFPMIQEVVDFGTTWDEITQNVNNTLNYDQIIEKLKKLGETNETYSELVSRLPDPTVNGTLLSPEQLRLRNAFVSDISKPKVDMYELVITPIKGGGISVTYTTAAATDERKLKQDWTDAFNQITPDVSKHKKEEENGNIYLDLKSLLEDADYNSVFPDRIADFKTLDKNEVFNKRLEFLTNLGIVFSEPTLNSTEFFDFITKKTSLDKLRGFLTEYSKTNSKLKSTNDLTKKRLNNSYWREVIKPFEEQELTNSKKFFSQSVKNAEGSSEWLIKQWNYISKVYNSLNDVETYPTYKDLQKAEWLKQFDIDGNPYANGLILRTLFNLDKTSPTYGQRRVVADENNKPILDKNGNFIYPKITLQNYNGVKVVGGEGTNEGKTTTRLSGFEKLVQNMNTLLLKGVQEHLRYGDKSSSFGTAFSHILDPLDPKANRLVEIGTSKRGTIIPVSDFVKDGEYEQIPNALPTSAYRLLLTNLASEIMPMQRNVLHGVGNNFTHYKNNIKELGVFNSIVSKENKERIFKEIVNHSTDLSLKDIYKILSTMPLQKDFEEKVKKDYKNLQKQLDTKGTLSPEDYLHKDLLLQNGEKRSFKQIGYAYVVNSLLYNIEHTKLITQDPRFYKVDRKIGNFLDFYKRIQAFLGDGNIFVVDKQTNEYLAKNGVVDAIREAVAKKLGVTIQPNSTDGTIKSVIFKDNEYTASKLISVYMEHFVKQGFPEEYLKQALKAYNKINEADGQGYMTLDELKQSKLRAGSSHWTELHEIAYQKEAAFLRGEESTPLTKEEVALFMPQKWQYGGITTEQTDLFGGVSAPVYYKFSAMPLIPSMIKDTPLEQIHDNLVKQGVGLATFESGSKISSIQNENGQFNPFYEDYNTRTPYTGEYTFNNVHYQYLKEQVNIDPSLKEKVTFSTQMRKLLFINTFTNGVANRPEFAALEKRFTNTIKNLISEEKNTIIKNLGAVLDPKTGNYILDDAKVAEFFKKEFEERGLPDEVVNYLQVGQNGKFTYALDASLKRAQIEKIIASIANNRLVKQKINGEALIQLAATGLEHNSTAKFNEVQEDTDLRPYTPTDKGTLAMQIKIAFSKQWRPLLNLTYKGEKIKTIERLNKAIKDENWLNTDNHRAMITVTGVRIPVQGLNSHEFMEVQTFLPESAGGVIVMHPSIVAKSGGDFDIDKLTTFFPNLDKKGNLIKLKSEEDLKKAYDSIVSNFQKEDKASDKLIAKIFGITEEELQQELIDELVENKQIIPFEQFKNIQNKKAYENDLIDIMKQVLSHPDNAFQLIRPNDIDLLKPGSEIYKELNKDEDYENSFASSVDFNEAAKQFVSNLVGKSNLGIAAVMNVFSALSQRAGLTLNPEFTHYTTSGKSVSKKTRINLAHNTVKVNGEERISLSGYTSKDQTYPISDIISQMINGYLEVAKDSWVFNINAVREFLPTMMFTTMAGVDAKTMIAFFNQPIMNEYLKDVQKYKSLFMKIKDPEAFQFATIRAVEDIITSTDGITDEKLLVLIDKLNKEKTVEEYNDEGVLQEPFTYYLKENILNYLQDKAEENKDLFTEKRLTENANGVNKFTPEENLMVLAHFVELELMSKKLSNLQRSLNADTKKMNSVMEIQQRQKSKELAEKSGLFPQKAIDKLFNQSTISAFTHTKYGFDSFSKSLWANLLEISNHPEYNKILSNLIDNDKSLKFEFKNSNLETFSKTLKNDFITYLYHNNVFDNGVLVASIVKQLLKPGASSFVSEFRELKSKYPNLINEFPFLGKLTTDVAKGKANIKFNKRLDAQEANSAVQQVRSLLKFNNPEYTKEQQLEIQKFADKYVKFAIIQSGLNSSIYDLTESLPNESYSKDMNSFVKAFKEILDNPLAKDEKGKEYNQAEEEVKKFYKLFKTQRIKFFNKATNEETGETVGNTSPERGLNYVTFEGRKSSALDLTGEKTRIAQEKKENFFKKIKELTSFYNGKEGGLGYAQALKEPGLIVIEDFLDKKRTSKLSSSTPLSTKEFDDKNLNENKELIDKQIEELKEKAYKDNVNQIVFNSAGYGQEIREKAPLTFQYLSQRLKEEFNFPNPNANIIISEENLVSSPEMKETVIQEEPKTIYSQLGNKTATGNVVIKGVYQQEGIQYAKSIGGIFSLRVNNSNKHFGNPFSSVPAEIAKGLTATNSTKESVEKYIDWVINSQEERAKWIREQLKSGILKGKPIVYYKELGEPSHATALDYLINKYNWDLQEEPKVVKEGVDFVFEQSPELANQIYSKILTNSGISGENLLSLLLKDNIIEKQCS